MSEEQKAHIELISSGECDQWPEAVTRRLDYLSEIAQSNDFSILCVVGLSHKTKQMSVQFSAKSWANPHLVEMLDDMVEMFILIAKRLKQ